MGNCCVTGGADRRGRMMNTRVSVVRRLRKAVPLLIILLVALAGFITLRDFLSFETLRANRDFLTAYRDEHFLVASLLFIATYIVIVGFSLPGATIATLTGGFLFGVFPGALYNVSAATIGACAIFLAARYGLGDYLAAKIDESSGPVKRLKEGIHQDEISYLFLMRLVPAVPFFLANVIPSFIGVSFRNFVLTTFFGIIPGGVVYTFVGAGLGTVFERGESPHLGIIFEWYVLGPIICLCVLAALPILLKRIYRRQ